jgi:hypothetical protein
MNGSASQNGAKVQRILEDRAGSAVLYRTAVAGPSGQRRQTPVARVEYTYERGAELAAWCPPGRVCFCDEPAGYLARTTDPRGEWAVWGHEPARDGYWLIGWADSPAIGADVLVNGEHAAMANHDSARVSRGGFTRYQPDAAGVAA